MDGKCPGRTKCKSTRHSFSHPWNDIRVRHDSHKESYSHNENEIWADTQVIDPVFHAFHAGERNHAPRAIAGLIV